MSVTDIAYCILKNRGQSIHFKELIGEIMQAKAIKQENPGRLIAQMHTEINLDSRFIHYGNGQWGLREWQPKANKVIKIRPEKSTPVRPRPILRDEEEYEDDPLDAGEDDELFEIEDSQEGFDDEADEFDDEDEE